MTLNRWFLFGILLGLKALICRITKIAKYDDMYSIVMRRCLTQWNMPWRLGQSHFVIEGKSVRWPEQFVLPPCFERTDRICNTFEDTRVSVRPVFWKDYLRVFEFSEGSETKAICLRLSLCHRPLYVSLKSLSHPTKTKNHNTMAKTIPSPLVRSEWSDVLIYKPRYVDLFFSNKPLQFYRPCLT